MSYANFKKVHEDEHHAKFKHENGSELKVAKKGLSAKMRKDLEGLPMYAGGGDVPSSLQASDPFADSSGSVDSGIPGINININHPSPAAAPAQDASVFDQAIGTKSGMAEAFPGENQLAAAHAQNPDELKFDWDPKSGVGIHHVPGLPDQTMPSTPGGELASNGPGLEGALPPPGSDQPLAASAAPSDASSGAMGQAPAPVAEVPNSPAHHYEATKQHLIQEDQNIQHDMQNGHIKPETMQDLFAKKDTLGKIGTLFGLMLSGAGSGLTGQPNAVLEMMNQQIKNDLDAQTKNQTAGLERQRIYQQGVLNKAQIGQLNAQTNIQNMTMRNMAMNRAALHSLVMQAQKLPLGSSQRAQAEQTLAMLSQAVQSENFNLADRAATASAYYSTMFGGAGAGASQDAQVAQRIQGLRAVNPEMAKDLERRYVPGIGVSSIPIPDGTRQELVSKQKLLNTGNDLLEYSKTHSNIVPGTPEYKYGVAKAMAFQQEVREGMLGTVFRESEKPLLEKFVSENPAGALKAFSTQPKLRAILDTTRLGMDTLKKSYGLPSGGGQSQQPQQQASSGGFRDGQTASDKSGNKVIFKNGAWQPYSNVAKK